MSSRTNSVTKDNCTNMHLEKLNCHKKEQKRNLVNEDITHYILTDLALRVVKMSVSFCNVLNSYFVIQWKLLFNVFAKHVLD